MVVSKKATIYATFFLSVIHWTFFALQMAVLPYITKDLHLDNIQFGYIQTAFAVVQMIGNPLFSHFCSSHMKMSLAVSFLTCAISYFLTAISNGFYVLMLSRLVCFMAQNPIGLQTVISTVTTPEERTVMFSRLGATFGIGFIFGSILGGSLAHILGYYLPSFIGAVVCVAVIPVIFIYLPEKSAQEGERESRGSSSGLFAHYARLLGVRRVFVVLLTKNLCLFPVIIFTVIIGVYLVDEHNVTPGENAILSVYTGVLMTLFNAVGIGMLRKKYSDLKLMNIGFAVTAVTGVSLILLTHYWHFFIAMPLLATSLGLVGTVSDSLMTTAVKPSDHALVVGLAWAVDSVVRVIGPTVAGYMLTDLGFVSFGYATILGCLLAGAVFSLFITTPTASAKAD